MLKYKHYHIKDADHFNEADFPNMVSQLEILKEGLSHLPSNHKNDMIISYARDRSADNIWKAENPKTMELISGGSFGLSHLEWLFESCLSNQQFTIDFENYIRKKMDEKAD